MLVPKHVFAVGKCAAKEQGRYAINGVLLKRDNEGKPHAVATDGKMLIAATWAEDKEDEFPETGIQGKPIENSMDVIVPLNSWNEMGRNVPKKSTRRGLMNAQVRREGNNIYSAATNLEQTKNTHAREVPGVFPKYEQIIPRFEAAAVVCVRAEYLAQIACAMAEAAGSEQEEVYIAIQQDPSRPLLLASRSPNNKVVGVLMPIGSNAKQHVQFINEAVRAVTGKKLDAVTLKAKPLTKADFSAFVADHRPMGKWHWTGVNGVLTQAHAEMNGSFEHFRKWFAEVGAPSHADSIKNWSPEPGSPIPAHGSWKEAAEANGERVIGKPEAPAETSPPEGAEVPEEAETPPEAQETRSAGFGAEEGPDPDETQELSPEEAALMHQLQEAQAQLQKLAAEQEKLKDKVQHVNRLKRLAS